MRKLTIALSLLLLAGCTPLKVGLLRVLTDNTAYVMQDEYVIWADGWWCEYAPPKAGFVLASGGARWCGNRPAKPPGLYLVDSAGRVLQKSEGQPHKYSKVQAEQAQRECGRYLSQGIACAPNFLVDKLETNDPLFGDLWGLTHEGIDAKSLWVDGESSPDIKVAVIDTGVHCEHEEFEGCAGQFDAVSDSGTQSDNNGHGTHCAGSVCARGGNGRGISGVSQRCKILAAKFMGDDGSGSLYTAVKSIQWAIDQGAHIISASWGAPYGNSVLKKAIERADAAGVLFVTAAGNDAKNLDETPQYPANYDFPNMITVGSHNDTGGRSWFSNWGLQTVEVFAPGTDILSTWSDGDYKTISGTSMATPHVSGLAAVLWQRELGKGTKREQMLRVRDAIFAMGSGELGDESRFGIVRVAYKPTPEPTLEPEPCKSRRCKKCFKECNKRFVCKCGKRTKCRKSCREKTNCEKGCK